MKKQWLRVGAAALIASITTLAGCVAQGPAVPANEAPLAIFVPSVSNISKGQTVDFNASDSVDSDGSIVSYEWSFGDFTVGTGEFASHTFANAGQFTVRLTVTDNQGATGTSTTVISVAGVPNAPTGLTKVGAGCCDTYGQFSWNALPGAQSYEVAMDGRIGCLTDHSATFGGGETTGVVRAFGLCLGSQYDVKIRAQANGQWGPWSSTIRITL